MCDTCGCHHHSRIIEIKGDIKSKNDLMAEENRKIFIENNIRVINLLSSPGSGKTTLLEKTLVNLQEKSRFAVIEGDLQTDNDKRRIEKTGVPVRQINTGSACHLDAQMIKSELTNFDLSQLDTLFIENVGNLVCPATFDLGEHQKVALLSVAEGDDKPSKYPVLFHNSTLVLITKIDLLPYVDFDIKRCRREIKEINPECHIIEISAKSSEGMDCWYDWLLTHRGAK